MDPWAGMMNVPPQPPSDPDIRKLIERTVQYVRRNGAEFEKMTKEKNAGNPRFGFLFPGHPLHPFYLFMCRFGSGGAPPPHTLQDPPTHLGSAPPATNMPHPSSGAGPHPGGHDPSAPQHPRMPPPFIHQGYGYPPQFQNMPMPIPPQGMPVPSGNVQFPPAMGMPFQAMNPPLQAMELQHPPPPPLPQNTPPPPTSSKDDDFDDIPIGVLVDYVLKRPTQQRTPYAAVDMDAIFQHWQELKRFTAKDVSKETNAAVDQLYAQF